MKTTILVLSTVFSLFLLPQKELESNVASKYITRTATISFNSSMPGFEEVAAVNNKSSIVLNAETDELAALALVKEFKFKVALMEEHFNENYIESDLYPKAILRGQLENFSVSDLNSAPQEVTLTGTLEMHGQKKEILIPIRLSKTDDGVQLSASLDVNPEKDFGIKIPSVVRKKVSDTTTITVEALLK